MPQRLPALILGDDPVNGLGVARNLGRSGIPVHRLGAAAEPLLKSRYIKSHHVLPGLDAMSDDAYVEVLDGIRGGFDAPAVLFPITDLHVLRVSRLASRLGDAFRITTAPLDAVTTLVNKRRFYEAVEAAGVVHPRSRFPETAAEFERAAEEIGYPVYLKPEISPLFHRHFHCKGFVAHDAVELRAQVAEVLASGLKVMLQEIIPGDATFMHGCAGYRRDGESVWVCYRRVREYPAGFGNSSMLESCKSFVHKTKLLEFLGSLDYHGLFDAEFKLDPRHGTYCLIEINARSWWQNLLPTRAGINLIELAYRDAATEPGDPPVSLPPQSYAEGVKWIHDRNDFYAAREQHVGWGSWLASLRGKSDFAFFAPDDPIPATMQIRDTVLGKLRGLTGSA